LAKKVMRGGDGCGLRGADRIGHGGRRRSGIIHCHIVQMIDLREVIVGWLAEVPEVIMLRQGDTR
jgi:hypothetical protein